MKLPLAFKALIEKKAWPIPDYKTPSLAELPYVLDQVAGGLKQSLKRYSRVEVVSMSQAFVRPGWAGPTAYAEDRRKNVRTSIMRSIDSQLKGQELGKILLEVAASIPWREDHLGGFEMKTDIQHALADFTAPLRRAFAPRLPDLHRDPVDAAHDAAQVFVLLWNMLNKRRKLPVTNNGPDWKMLAEHADQLAEYFPTHLVLGIQEPDPAECRIWVAAIQ